jgi:hypothetical protein
MRRGRALGRVGKSESGVVPGRWNVISSSALGVLLRALRSWRRLLLRGVYGRLDLRDSRTRWLEYQTAFLDFYPCFRICRHGKSQAFDEVLTKPA